MEAATMLGVNLDLDEGDTENLERRTKTGSENEIKSGRRKAALFKNESSQPDKTFQLKSPTRKEVESNSAATIGENIACHQDDRAVISELAPSQTYNGVVKVKREPDDVQTNVKSVFAPSFTRLNCNFCTKTFKERTALRKHKRRKHPTEEACQFCSKHFKNIQRHVQAKHTNENKGV